MAVLVATSVFQQNQRLTDFEVKMGSSVPFALLRLMWIIAVLDALLSHKFSNRNGDIETCPERMEEESKVE